MSSEHWTRGWDQGWIEHEHAQLVRLSRLGLYEKIKWLEEAQRVAESLRKARSAAEQRSSGGS